MAGLVAIHVREGHPDFIDLPWHLPLAAWEGATERQVDRLLAAGAEAYLTKPARVAEFLGLLDRILGRSAHAAEEAHLQR